MSNIGTATYGNILIKWVASTSETSLSVTISSGGALIGSMTFTPTTLNQKLKYSNPPQSASGNFTAQFSADGKSGQLSCSDFVWDLTSGKGGPITGLIGIWNTST